MRVPPLERSHNTEIPLQSRRDLLATIGSTSLFGLTGCLTLTDNTDNKPRYRLSTRSLGSTLTRDFTRKPDGPFKTLDQNIISKIIAQGPITINGVRLSGIGADNLSYVKQDGIYYKISVTETGSVTRKKWLIWHDKINSKPPATSEIYSSSLGLGNQTPLDTTYGLSELDVHAVETAEGRMAPGHGFIDLEDKLPKHRGYVFLRRSPDETDLVPEPPFTHVEFESGNGIVYAQVVVERVSVELTQFTYTATPVGDSEDAFNEYLRKKYLETAFSSEGLSSEQQSLLLTARSGQGYEETVPLSDGFTAILERINVADTEPPKPRKVEFSDDVYFGYDNTYYEAQLEVFG